MVAEPFRPQLQRSSRRRRPTGQPPPLPHHLRSSGAGWLIAAIVLTAGSVVIFARGLRGPAVEITVADDAVTRWLATVRVPGLTPAAWDLADAGAIPAMVTIGYGLVAALLVLRRFRHLLVFVASFEVANVLSGAMQLVVHRPRPFGVPVRFGWGGFALPSVEIVCLCVVAVGVLYTLVPAGRWRDIGKFIAAGLVALVALAMIRLGVDAPTDVLAGAAIGVTIPLLAFRWFTPDEAFPIVYRRGRSAHLDLGGRRGEAIRVALKDQLGLVVTEVAPFGLAGSGGSTPMRLRCDGEPGTYLFGKLYARSHLRADRWYKLGRELLYGRLEDEKPFSGVRRLVQQEDYALRLMHDAGLPTPKPHGFVELTPEREYVLVTEFFDHATELGQAAVDDGVIDQGLAIVGQLWHAGLAHRDIKPANLLVRDGHLLLIDVAFAEARPTPWRQAVDLANMMLCLALRAPRSSGGASAGPPCGPACRSPSSSSPPTSPGCSRGTSARLPHFPAPAWAAVPWRRYGWKRNRCPRPPWCPVPARSRSAGHSPELTPEPATQSSPLITTGPAPARCSWPSPPTAVPAAPPR